jgi:trehalose 6-phosphate synthase/phosphatase
MTRTATYSLGAKLARRRLGSGVPLVIMSNRAPIRIVHEDGRERIEPTVGGVGTTFLRLLESHGGLWIAWSGSRENPGRLELPRDHPRFSLVFAPLTERDISQYYYGMCNRGLWPLMHFMTLNCHFESAHWANYERVNRHFARIAADNVGRNAVVWVQDFHLALVPRMLRELRGDLPIGLFWHVPFPPEQLFRVLPWRRELMLGMLGADVIGFHTRSYVRHFLDCCERIAGATVERATGIVQLDGRRVRVGAFPLGIPNDYFAEVAARPAVQARARRIRRMLGNKTMILGVDRLDYTKGVIERLLAFERFLELNPRYRRRVTLVLIAVPSRTKVRDYAMLKRQLDEVVGRVIGRFSSSGWVPIRYLYTQLGPEDLVAYYEAADIALLTPLRDGMNLVAKEYIASQPPDGGVLILSEFAGAAEELTEALLVNPYDVDAVAEQIRVAIEMPLEERRTRLKRLRDRVARNNLEAWSEKFLTALAPEYAVAPQRQLVPAAV